MAGELLESNVVLSDFGTRIFMVSANYPFTSEAKELENPTELLDVLSAENLGFTRGSVDYRPLANGGWPKKAFLGFETDDMSLSMVRSEQGAYNEQSSYWTLYNKLKQFKVNRAFFGIVICRPVAGMSDEDLYEARYWDVVCNGVEEGASSDAGREYTATFIRSGAPKELDTTYTAETDAFTFKLRPEV